MCNRVQLDLQRHSGREGNHVINETHVWQGPIGFAKALRKRGKPRDKWNADNGYPALQLAPFAVRYHPIKWAGAQWSQEWYPAKSVKLLKIHMNKISSRKTQRLPRGLHFLPAPSKPRLLDSAYLQHRQTGKKGSLHSSLWGGPHPTLKKQCWAHAWMKSTIQRGQASPVHIHHILPSMWAGSSRQAHKHTKGKAQHPPAKSSLRYPTLCKARWSKTCTAHMFWYERSMFVHKPSNPLAGEAEGNTRMHEAPLLDPCPLCQIICHLRHVCNGVGQANDGQGTHPSLPKPLLQMK